MARKASIGAFAQLAIVLFIVLVILTVVPELKDTLVGLITATK